MYPPSAAQGLVELHRVGLVHGNIKPSNVHLNHHSKPLARLSDYGFSQLRANLWSMACASDDRAQRLTYSQVVTQLESMESGKIFSLPVHSAPELLSNPRQINDTGEYLPPYPQYPHMGSDIYALGILMWTVLADRRAFVHINTEYDFCDQVHSGSRPSLDDLPLDLPVFFRDVLKACWSEGLATLSLH